MHAADRTLSDQLGLDRIRPVDLDVLLEHAEALHRVDRKYLVPRDKAAEVVAALRDSHRVLQIDGRLTTSYQSTYFDTEDLATVRHHLQRRRRRWKVRSRTYVEDARSQLEVKTTSLRGRTLKTIEPIPVRGDSLDSTATAFIDATLTEQAFGPVGATLRPSVVVTYERATLADLEAGTRLTLDHGVSSTSPRGRVWIDADFLVVETKGHLRPGIADTALRNAGIRPQRFSKYVSAASLLSETLPDNDVRRLLGRQLHRQLNDDCGAVR